MGGDIVITSCRFLQGAAKGNGGGVSAAGAISGNLLLSNVTAAANAAGTSGGFLALTGTASSFASESLVGSNNTAGASGGCLYLAPAKGEDLGALPASIFQSEINGNEALASGGAVAVSAGLALALNGSRFSGNSAGRRGTQVSPEAAPAIPRGLMLF